MPKENTKYWQDGERRGAEQPKSEITYIESKYLFSGCCVFYMLCLFPLFSHPESVFLCCPFFFFFLNPSKALLRQVCEQQLACYVSTIRGKVSWALSEGFLPPNPET